MRIKHEYDIVVLSFDEKEDICGASFIETVGHIVKDGHLKILCDFSNIDYLDESGLYIIAIAFKNIRDKGGLLKFCCVSDKIKGVFKRYGMSEAIDMVSDEDKAMEDFRTIEKIEKLNQRRRYPRIEYHESIKFIIKDQGPKNEMTGEIYNISGVGVFVKSENILPLNTVVLFKIKAAFKEAVELEGRIRWSADKDIQPYFFPGMGIEFINISPDKRKSIITFVEDRMDNMRHALLDSLMYGRM